jgi:hypothetical protein
MSESLKLAVLAAVRRLLAPLVRLMVEAGIGVGEFHALSKAAFVQAAKDRSADEGKPVSISAIAMLTGLRRAEVRALLAAKDDGVPSTERNRHRAERVLSGWWNDADFLDADGRPLPLKSIGPGITFETLAKRYSGDPRVRALRTELLRAKAIAKLPDGRLQALSRTFATARWEPSGVAVMGERVRDLLQTLLYNLRHPSRPRYARTVMSTSVDPRYVPMLLRDITTSAEAMADGFDDAVNSPQANIPAGYRGDTTRLGMTVFVFEEPNCPGPGGHAAFPTAAAGRGAAPAQEVLEAQTRDAPTAGVAVAQVGSPCATTSRSPSVVRRVEPLARRHPLPVQICHDASSSKPSVSSSHTFAEQGVPLKQQRAALTEALRRVHEPLQRHEASSLHAARARVALLAAWHRESQYLNADGEPLALPLIGSPSLTELFEKFLPTSDPAGLTSTLEREGHAVARRSIGLATGPPDAADAEARRQHAGARAVPAERPALDARPQRPGRTERRVPPRAHRLRGSIAGELARTF